jgi:hypothetical protein
MEVLGLVPQARPPQPGLQDRLAFSHRAPDGRYRRSWLIAIDNPFGDD